MACLALALTGLPEQASAQLAGPTASPIGIIRHVSPNSQMSQLSSRNDSTTARFSAAKGAVVGGAVGGAIGALIVILKGDYASCASDIGPFYCRLGEMSFVVGAAAAGALLGFLLGEK